MGLYALPVGLMLATSLAVIRLARDNEIMALRLSGVSLLRVFLPLYLAGLVVSGLSFLDSEKIAPRAADAAWRVLRESILGLSGANIKPNLLFRTQDNAFCHVRQVDVRRNTLHYVIFYRLQHSRVAEVLIAEYAQREGDRWWLHNGRRHLFDSQGNKVSTAPFLRWPLALNRDIDKLWQDETKPERMTAREVYTTMVLLREAGERDRAREMEYYFHSKFALPLACLIMAMLAAPLSLRFAHTGYFTGVVLTVVVAFFYNGTMNWCKVFALNGTLSPTLAAWSHIFLFGALALVLLKKM